MNEVIGQVRAYCRQHSLIHPGDTVIAACSGGPDSLVLLDVLAALRPEYGLGIVVCYVHHGIRRGADQEAVFVRTEAEKRKCLYTCRYADVPALAQKAHLSLEAAGRTERYRLLREEKERYHAASIAVAHQRDDQAETVLLHLLRGSGLAGLGGMKPCSGDIIRPLLCISRRHVEQYIADHGLTPCCDESNESPEFTRNRIRLQLLPYLKTYNPAIADELNRLAQIAGDEDEYISRCAAAVYEQHVVSGGTGGACISRDVFRGQAPALQRRLVRMMCREATGSERDISFHHVETIRELAAKGRGKQFQTGTFTAYTTKDALCIVPFAGRRRKTDRNNLI